MDKSQIAIIGYGVVGRAMDEFFGKRYKTIGYDPALLAWTKDDIADCPVAVICVPTPTADTMRCDTSIVEEVVGWCQADLIIIKSTVEPGTTDRLKEKTGKRIVFSPEYLGESTYCSPYNWSVAECPFYIFGGDPKDTSEAVDLFIPVAGPVKQYVQTTAKAAEMAKYMENTFFATKLTFVYEMAMICKAAGLDYNVVRDLWLLDPRINPMHTAVFKNNKQPFAGKCLPKDLAALVSYAEQALGYEPALLREVIDSNDRIGRLR